MTLAHDALFTALRTASYTTSQMFVEVPEAYETSLDHVLISNIQRETWFSNGRLQGDKSAYDLSLRFVGGAGQIVDLADPTRKVEVADLAFVLAAPNCPTKLVLLQSKKLTPKRVTAGAFTGRALDDLRTYIRHSLATRRTFDSGSKYGDSAPSQWKAIAAINRATTRLGKGDLVYYLLYHPTYYPSAPPASHDAVSLRVLKQSDITLRTLPRNVIEKRFTDPSTEFPRFIVDSVQCQHGVRIRDNGPVSYDSGGDEFVFDFGIVPSDFRQENEPPDEFLSKFERPVLDLRECPVSFISMTQENERLLS